MTTFNDIVEANRDTEDKATQAVIDAASDSRALQKALVDFMNDYITLECAADTFDKYAKGAEEIDGEPLEDRAFEIRNADRLIEALMSRQSHAPLTLDELITNALPDEYVLDREQMAKVNTVVKNAQNKDLEAAWLGFVNATVAHERTFAALEKEIEGSEMLKPLRDEDTASGIICDIMSNDNLMAKLETKTGRDRPRSAA